MKVCARRLSVRKVNNTNVRARAGCALEKLTIRTCSLMRAPQASESEKRRSDEELHLQLYIQSGTVSTL